jgi:hypothetical protein
MKNFWLLIAVFFLVVACSEVEVTKVTSESQEGIRFYRPHPYLLVTREKAEKPSSQSKSSDQKEKSSKGVQAENPVSTAAPPSDNVTTYIQVIWLPDKSEHYAIKIKSGLGSVDSTIKLENGWQLTQFGGKIDTKVPETVTAATSFLKALPPMGMIEKEGKPLAPGLYRLEFDKNTGYVNGAVRVF